MIKDANSRFDNCSIIFNYSIRQIILHWGYELAIIGSIDMNYCKKQKTTTTKKK